MKQQLLFTRFRTNQQQVRVMAQTRHLVQLCNRLFTINYSEEINFTKLPREIQHPKQHLNTESGKTLKAEKTYTLITFFVVAVSVVMLCYLKQKISV